MLSTDNKYSTASDLHIYQIIPRNVLSEYGASTAAIRMETSFSALTNRDTAGNKDEGKMASKGVARPTT